MCAVFIIRYQCKLKSLISAKPFHTKYRCVYTHFGLVPHIILKLLVVCQFADSFTLRSIIDLMVWKDFSRMVEVGLKCYPSFETYVVYSLRTRCHQQCKYTQPFRIHIFEFTIYEISFEVVKYHKSCTLLLLFRRESNVP